MDEATKEITNIRRISANILSLESIKTKPIYKKRLRPKEFKGDINLKPYIAMQFAIDVTGCRLPILYTFASKATSNFSIYFSTKQWPDHEQNEIAVHNKNTL